MNIHAAAAYAAHLLKARSTAGHGVHSPLMYSFITGVIGGRTDKPIMNEVRNLRREMLSDSRVVRVTDLGAGSSVMQHRERSIRQIARIAALPAREAALLMRIAASLDRILGRVPEQQAGGPQATCRPGIGLQATRQPEKDREPTGWPVQDQMPTELPTNEQESADFPAQKQKSIGQTELEKEPTGWPPQEQKQTVRQEKDREPTRLPAQQQKQTRRLENILDDTPPGDLHQPDNNPVILELGTSLGISTLALALGAPHKRIITVEGCPELAVIARENLRRHGADNAEVLNMEFSQALAHLKATGTKIDMAFIDGNHHGAALIDYTHRIMEMGDEIIIMADDIHLNSDMIRAWKSLLTGQQTPGPAMASLETLRLGIIFCLRNLTPGHYRIRY